MARKKQEDIVKSEEIVDTEQENNLEDFQKSDQINAAGEAVEISQNEQELSEAPKKYVVIHDFKDLNDKNIIYINGDIYPRRADAVIDEERIKELSSSKNKIGKPLIKEISEQE
ncbi:hypothetical protein [Peribacillus sp. NPDC096448]|uniref:hypothetical protein n=1 Tax=Peribacillus sp. NPDC096448 TaxID=3364395 RepID=UPI003804599C